ncbi:MFS transporter [Micromonospora sp. NPDC047548]|uniref:MFS transporter n=1 Tax=Micromonospora sp. NPDC047548 TaxID=3155624 RepID=UPI0033D7BC2F
MWNDQLRDVTTRRATSRQWAALGVLVLAVVLLAVDATVLSLAVPALSRDLGPSATELLWIGDVYSFALAGLLVTMGTLADRIGRKKLLLTGSAAFGAASVLAALAPNAGTLIAARLLLGVAGATLMPSTLSIIRNIFTDPRQRTSAIAVWSAGAGGGAAIGPLVGGVLLSHFWWGSVFLINVPVMVVLIVAGFFLIPESRDPAPGRFDLPSALLSMLAIIPLVYAVKQTATHGIGAVQVVAAVVAVVSGVVFVRRQSRLTAPLIDVTLFRRPAFSGAVTTNFIAIFAFSGLLFFFSQYLQLVRGYSPLRAGLGELPATIASIVVVGIASLAVSRYGRGRALAAGLALTSLGLALLALVAGADNYGWLALALVPVGLGVGLALTLTTDAVVSSVPSKRAGAASAISETAYELGVALGIALLGTMLTIVYRGNIVLPTGVPADTEAAVRDSLASAAAALPPDSELLVAAREAFVHAMQAVSIAAAVIVVVSAVVAWRVVPSDRTEGRH